MGKKRKQNDLSILKRGRKGDTQCGEERPEVSSLSHHLRPWRSPNPAYAASKDHVWVRGDMSEGVCVNVLGSYYRQRSCRCPWSGLPPGTMLVSKGCADLPGPALCCGAERAGTTPCRLQHSGEQRNSFVPCMSSATELALVAGAREPIPRE